MPVFSLPTAPIPATVLAFLLAAQPTNLPSAKERGEDLYSANCIPCHGPKALGDGPLGPTLGAPRLAGLEAAPTLRSIILDGKGDMPAFRQVFDASDAGRLMVYLSSLDPKTGEPRAKALPKNATKAPGKAGGAPTARPGAKPAPSSTARSPKTPSEAPAEDTGAGG